jgi:hypothetical protein
MSRSYMAARAEGSVRLAIINTSARAIDAAKLSRDIFSNLTARPPQFESSVARAASL